MFGMLECSRNVRQQRSSSSAFESYYGRDFLVLPSTTLTRDDREGNGLRIRKGVYQRNIAQWQMLLSIHLAARSGCYNIPKLQQ